MIGLSSALMMPTITATASNVPALAALLPPVTVIPGTTQAATPSAAADPMILRMILMGLFLSHGAPDARPGARTRNVRSGRAACLQGPCREQTAQIRRPRLVAGYRDRVRARAPPKPAQHRVRAGRDLRPRAVGAAVRDGHRGGRRPYRPRRRRRGDHDRVRTVGPGQVAALHLRELLHRAVSEEPVEHLVDAVDGKVIGRWC